MKFTEAVKKCFRHYADFSGRAPRSEYWWFMLFLLPIAVVTTLLDFKLFPEMIHAPFSILYTLTLTAPIYAVTARRFHDVNLSGWWQIPFGVTLVFSYLPKDYLAALPYSAIVTWAVLVGIYSIWAIVKMATVGTCGPNQYGPDPLERAGVV